MINGVLFLLTKLDVVRSCNSEDAAVELGTTSDYLWDAEDHIIAAHASPQSYDCQVPLELVQRLRFIAGEETVPLKFRALGPIEQLTLRSVRELAPESATELDRMPPPMQPVYLEQRHWRIAALPEEVATAAG